MTLRWRAALDLLATLLLIAAAGAMLWWIVVSQSRSQPTQARPRPAGVVPAEPIPIEGSSIKGEPSAAVIVLVYADFQCAACGEAARAMLPSFVRDYVETGRSRLAYKHLPLTRIHPLATIAGAAAECAGSQGHFWPMHDSLFDQQDALDLASLLRRARELKLDQKDFVACLAGDAVARVEKEGKMARQLGIASTPTFIVGIVQKDGLVKAMKRIDGAGRLEDLKSAVDDVLAAVGKN